MDTILLHALLDDKSVWSNFSKCLKSKMIHSESIPFYFNYVTHFITNAMNTPTALLSSERVIAYLINCS